MRAEPVQTSSLVNGVELAVWHWAGAKPAIVLCHATGLHARCWDQIVTRLPDRECIAFDFRGHGRSGKTPPPYSWRRLGEDLAALLGHMQIRAAIGVGHSMGGHTVTLAAAIRPEAFVSLVLLDPVIRARETYTGPTQELENVLRRRNSWVSPDQMFERFKDRMPFQAWDPAVLWDYCRFALLPSGDAAGLVLACPPAIEASIYANHSAKDSDIYDEIRGIRIPVRVVRSSMSGEFSGSNFRASATTPDLASFFAHGLDMPLRGVSHFIPMEAPEVTATLIANSVPLC